MGQRTLEVFHCWGKSECGSLQETNLDKQIDTHVTWGKQKHMDLEQCNIETR